MKMIASVALLVCCYAVAHSSEEKEFNDVKVTQSLADDQSDFANILLDTLVEKPILDESSASRILATFGLKGVGRNRGQAYTKSSIGSLAVKGDADAGKRFIKRLTGLFDEKQQGLRLIEHLLALILDNDLMDANAASKLAAANGYGVNIKVTRIQESTQEVSSDPVRPVSKGCCAKNLTPLYEVRINIGRDLQYIAHSKVLVDYMSNCGECQRFINYPVARVASSPDACQCLGVELIPVYYIWKPRLYKYEHDHYYTTDLSEAKRLSTQGYILLPWPSTANAPNGNPHVEYYCAKTQGECGATQPLRKYTWAHLHVYATSIEEANKKKIAGGAWVDQGIICYVWPAVPIQQL